MRWSSKWVLACCALVVCGCGPGWPSWTYRGQFVAAVAKADRIVVRDGGFDCCGPVDTEAVLFEVRDPAEIQRVLHNLDFAASQTQDRCNCCGFPGIDFYAGKERLALTALQHGKSLRWRGFPGDIRLTDTSQQWLVEWLIQHGVEEKEIPLGCGGPRRGLRRLAAQMKLAQSCLAQGEAHAAKGDLDAAVASFTQATKHDAKFALAWYRLGVVHEKKGNLSEAITDFDNALRVSEPFLDTFRAKAAKFITDSDVPRELDYKDLGEVYYARGRAYEKKGEMAKAKEDFALANRHGYAPGFGEAKPRSPHADAK